jgi:membrane associated rhomboid family serine protease
MSFKYTRPENFPPIVKNLLIINGLFFLAQYILDSQGIDPFLYGALFNWNLPWFKPYQFFTHMFMHGGFGHIFFNMFSLWMFGRILENVWGPKRFLFFYFACGIAAAFAQQFMGNFISAVGASGAIMGLFVAFGYLFPNSELLFLFIPFPIKAKYAVIIFVGIDLFSGLARMPGDQVAHWAHLGGAAAGFIIVYIWNKTNKKTFY